MKKKLKKAVKEFFAPSIKNEHLSIDDKINQLSERLCDLEADNLKLIVRIARLEAKLDNHEHGGG